MNDEECRDVLDMKLVPSSLLVPFPFEAGLLLNEHVIQLDTESFGKIIWVIGYYYLALVFL